jgi:hypothetical protein
MLLPAIAIVRSNASRRLSLLVIRLHPARGRNRGILASRTAPDKRVNAVFHRQSADFRIGSRTRSTSARVIVYMTIVI